MAKRKRAEWRLDGKLPSYRCPRCRGEVLIVVAAEWTAECAACGAWRKDQMVDFKWVETSLGGCWSTENLAVMDEVPSLLASMAPIWLAEELRLMATYSAEERKAKWDARVKALEGERAMRAADKGRTVNG